MKRKFSPFFLGVKKAQVYHGGERANSLVMDPKP